MSKIFNNILLIPMIIIFCLSFISILTLYSTNSSLAIRQLLRLCLGLIVLVIASKTSTKFWKKHAYSLYFISLVLLVLVEVVGKTMLGAQRWLDLYFISIQPSELMRITLIIVLASYFNLISTEDIKSCKYIVIPTLLTLLPVLLVLKQPDLGTAMLLILVYCSILLAAGIQLWKLALLPISVACVFPVIWSKLHDYQRDRILMFLHPELDMNGAGYHIIQSKIALGSGGISGKGLFNGTQSQLNFLPEKHNDFIFSTFGEKFGFIGSVILLSLYISLLIYNYFIALNINDKFERYLVFGLNSMLFFYIVINIAMVCGLLPVVGIPLPFLSYGGTALVVLMFSQGIIFACFAESSNKQIYNTFN